MGKPTKIFMRSAARIALVVCIMTGRHAHAAFTNGVERFDGTVKDLVTWEEMAIFSGSSISQNNALLMHAPYAADFTTRQQKIGLNQGVSAELTILSSEPGYTCDSWFTLTTNSRGTTAHLTHDSNVLYVTLDTFYNAIHGGDMANGNGGGNFFVQNLTQVYNKTYVLSIFRSSPTTAVFSASTPGGPSLGSYTHTFGQPNVPNDLFIGLYAQNGDVKWDNVSIFPEPTTATLLALSSVLALRRRR